MGNACQCINCGTSQQGREYYSNNTNITIQEIEKIITQNKEYEWNEERIAGLEIALDIIKGKFNE